MGIALIFIMATITIIITAFFGFSGQWYFSTFAGLMINLLLFLILGLIAWKTPAGTFLTAWLKKLSILELTSKDRRKRFLPVQVKDQMIRLKKGGSYIVTENSVYNEFNSGIPIMEANADYGVTVAPLQMQHCMGMKMMGFENIRDVEDTVECKSCNKKYKMSDIPAKKDPDLTEKFIFQCPNCKKEVKQDDFEEEFERNYNIKFPTNTTIRVHDMSGFFKYNLSPAIIDTLIEKTVQLRLDEQRGISGMTIAKIAGFGIVIICAAIAYIIITQQAGISCPPCICEVTNPTVIGG